MSDRGSIRKLPALAREYTDTPKGAMVLVDRNTFFSQALSNLRTELEGLGSRRGTAILGVKAGLSSRGDDRAVNLRERARRDLDRVGLIIGPRGFRALRLGHGVSFYGDEPSGAAAEEFYAAKGVEKADFVPRAPGALFMRRG